MSLTASVTSQAVVEWVRVFPKQATETYTSSVTFIKQLTTVAVSTISYLKNVFPEESYTVESFAGVNLRILKKRCRDELAQFVSTALAQAFEAFEKKYLQKLALCFYDGECHVDNLMEYHMFEYSYTPNGVTMDVTSKSQDKCQTSKYSFDNVRERTVQLLRSCVVIMQTCQNQLPSSYDVSLRLYYNDDAPEGYQAPGFLSTLEPVDHLEEASRGAVMRLGAVATQFHKLVASTYMREPMESSNEAQASQNAPMITQNEADDFHSKTQNAPMMTRNEADDFHSEELLSERSETESNTPRVLCPCGKHEPDNELMLTCDYCVTQQHAACFGRRVAVIKHCCTNCSDANSKLIPTDDRLALLTPKKRECLCILRRTLSWLGSLRTVCVSSLVDKFTLSTLNAVKLIKLLLSNRVIEDTDTDIMSPRKIITEQLTVVMNKYFQPDEVSLVDRLLAESLSQSQETRDLVGDALGPHETTTLQNATALGKIMKPPQDSVMEDATLKQYKEVILTNKQTDDDLPLSGKHNPVKDMENIRKNGKRKAGNENTRAGVKTKRAKVITNY